MTRMFLPESFRGVPIPARFRSWFVHLEDPVVVLQEFIAWLERSVPASSADHDEHVDVLQADRAQMVRGLIELGDLIDSPALRHRVTEVLASAGVIAVDSAGERFDPARHRAVDRVATPDASADGRIAETERLGYLDRGRPARLPDVLVYQHTASENGG